MVGVAGRGRSATRPRQRSTQVEVAAVGGPRAAAVRPAAASAGYAERWRSRTSGWPARRGRPGRAGTPPAAWRRRSRVPARVLPPNGGNGPAEDRPAELSRASPDHGQRPRLARSGWDIPADASSASMRRTTATVRDQVENVLGLERHAGDVPPPGSADARPARMGTGHPDATARPGQPQSPEARRRAAAGSARRCRRPGHPAQPRSPPAWAAKMIAWWVMPGVVGAASGGSSSRVRHAPSVPGPGVRRPGASPARRTSSGRSPCAR